MFRPTRLASAFVLVGIACGGGNGDAGGEQGEDDGGAEQIDCAWLESQNCWRDAVDAARECAPDEDLVALLAPDRLSCAYADGARVVFDEPVAADPIGTAAWSFEVQTGGERCISYLEVAGATTGPLAIMTSAGVIEMTGSYTDLTITCPDGSRHHTGDFLDLYQSCPAAEGGLPLLTVQSNPTQFGLELGDEIDGTVTLLQCAE